VCANCYKIYRFMDTQRYEQVLFVEKSGADDVAPSSKAGSRGHHGSRVREASEGHDHKQSVFDQETKQIDIMNSQKIRNLAKFIIEGGGAHPMSQESLTTTSRSGQRRASVLISCTKDMPLLLLLLLLFEMPDDAHVIYNYASLLSPLSSSPSPLFTFRCEAKVEKTRHDN
jgi:hypothetical protein